MSVSDDRRRIAELLGHEGYHDDSMRWHVWTAGCPRCGGPFMLHDHDGKLTCDSRPPCAGDLRKALLAAPKDGPGPHVRKGSALTRPAPPVGADLPALTAWISAQLRLPSPVARVTRWGSSAVSPVALTLDDGRRIRFGEATHIADGARLVQTVVLALGTAAPQLPLFTRADAQDVFSAVVRACQVTEVDDEAARTRDWLDSLTRLTREMHHGSYDDAAARWAALAWLTEEPEFDPRAHHLAFADERYRIPVLVWADGSSYVRVRDVSAYVRGVLGEHLAVQQIIPRMREIGCTQRIVETWRPKAPREIYNRRRVSVFILPQEEVETAETPLSPTSPVLPPRAHAPAHTRTAEGRSGTTAETPMAAGIIEVGDTDQVGDTRAGAVA